MTTLFNANTRSAYQAGYYTGAFTMKTLLRHGDFGLGALNRNDGELVVLDGHAYRTDVDGATSELPENHLTPYAAVLPFRAERTFTAQRSTKTQFEQQLATELPLSNRIWALRIHGHFDLVTAGAGEAQTAPYRPLAEVFATYHHLDHRHIAGTLVAFHCPMFLTGVDQVGAHYHFLADDHTRGGHVIDFRLTTTTVEACQATSYTVDLPTGPGFTNLDLTPFH